MSASLTVQISLLKYNKAFGKCVYGSSVSFPPPSVAGVCNAEAALEMPEA